PNRSGEGGGATPEPTTPTTPTRTPRPLRDRPMTALTFRTLDDVEYGRVDRVSPRVRRVIAENPSKFTYRGTGTYILGDGDVVVIDPGPILDSHRDALAAALRGERVRAILVTHCHSDHSPLAAWLAAESGAPTFGFGPRPHPDEELRPARTTPLTTPTTTGR